MPKRPDTLETVRLAIELLQRIPRGRKVTASDLHLALKDAGFDRDTRTIQRLLESLSLAFGVERDDSSKPYGYKWGPKAKGLSLSILNEQESLLLALAEQQLQSLLPASVMKAMGGFFEQARINLDPYCGSRRGHQWLKKVRVVSTTQPLLPPKIVAGVFEEVSNALYSNCLLELTYKNANGEEWQASVMPLGLAQQGPRLYLVCRIGTNHKERSLALNRILTARALPLHFDRPKDFDLQRFDADGQFGFGQGKRIRLTFRIDKESGSHLLESPLSIDQVVREFAEAYEISATVVDTAQLDWWLRGFGDRVYNVRRKPVPAP